MDKTAISQRAFDMYSESRRPHRRLPLQDMAEHQPLLGKPGESRARKVRIRSPQMASDEPITRKYRRTMMIMRAKYVFEWVVRDGGGGGWVGKREGRGAEILGTP